MLVFIDESGHANPNDSTQNPVLLGVCINEDDIKPLTNQIYRLKDKIYGKQDEVKATNLIREQTITKNRTKNKEFADELTDLVCGFEIAVFSIIMDKPVSKVNIPEEYLPKQYYLLLKKVEFYCQKHNYGKAIIIYDDINEGEDRKTAEAFNGFLFKSQFGKTFHKILEMPLFVSSAVAPEIQIADIFAGIVRHYYERNLDERQSTTEFEDWIQSLFYKIHTKTENNKQPNECFIEYGFQKMGNNFDYHMLP